MRFHPSFLPLSPINTIGMNSTARNIGTRIGTTTHITSGDYANERQPASGNFRATFMPFMREVRRTQNTRASVTRHSPRIFLATCAREVCRERSLNHNRNGGRIALQSKCTSANGGNFSSTFGRFRDQNGASLTEFSTYRSDFPR
jgi:hypothetical protein